MLSKCPLNRTGLYSVPKHTRIVTRMMIKTIVVSTKMMFLTDISCRLITSSSSYLIMLTAKVNWNWLSTKARLLAIIEWKT